MFRKPTPPPAPAPQPAAPPPARRFTDEAPPSKTVIGPRTHIRGQVSGDDPVDLSGTLDGSARTSSVCWVRAEGRVNGDVTAKSAVIEGALDGPTVVAEKVEIGAAARVRATLRAQVIAMAEGAVFEGEVHMEGRPGAGTPVAFKEKRKDRS